MNKLECLKYDKELSAFDLSKTAPCDDRIMTKLTLDDYDWMSYVFETYFPTKDQGLLHVKIEYAGFTVSEMVVTQKFDNDYLVIHKVEFDSRIFSDFLKSYMNHHIAQWEETYAFNGGELAIDLFNEILKHAKSYNMQSGVLDVSLHLKS